MAPDGKPFAARYIRCDKLAGADSLAKQSVKNLPSRCVDDFCGAAVRTDLLHRFYGVEEVALGREDGPAGALLDHPKRRGPAFYCASLWHFHLHGGATTGGFASRKEMRSIQKEYLGSSGFAKSTLVHCRKWWAISDTVLGMAR